MKQYHKVNISNVRTFNDEYKIEKQIGQGTSSKVYLCSLLSDPTKKVALKLIREDWLKEDPKNIHDIEKEIQTLKGLSHQKIVNILGYGSNGKAVIGPKVYHNLTYIIMEYVEG